MAEFKKSKILLATGALFIGSIITLFAIVSILNPFNKRQYDRNLWLESQPQERAAMARDALRRTGTRGMAVDEVVSILGQPDEKIQSPTDSGGNSLDGDITYSYYLGSWSAYGYDSAFLYIQLDGNGRVVRGSINGY